jgi:long-subunit acyl-CoA synthetase (AMP-forming)
MKALFSELTSRAERPALVTGKAAVLTGSEVLEDAERMAGELRERQAGCVASILANGPAWISMDLACLLAGVTHVPIPDFFTPSQVLHVLETAAVDTIISEPGKAVPAGFQPVTHRGLCLASRPGRRSPTVHPRTAKITFTSGTTGTPKGVCLGEAQLERVALALAERVEPLRLGRHLVTLPLAVLLENVAGVYAGLLAGSEIVFPPAGGTGLEGSSGFDPRALIASIDALKPDSLILLPQMLSALVNVLRAEDKRLSGLSFVAVGGARTAPDLIREARSLGLPAYEGYGLSECASVVTLNTPGQDRPGTVGRVLPHLDLRLANDGEVLVRCDEPIRYVGETPSGADWYPTGDLGLLDRDGFLTLWGRKRNVLVTGFGRNVCPEWVESELLASPHIAQALVFGDDLPGLLALLVAAPGAGEAELQRAVVLVNRQLPDYARLIAWAASPPFRPDRGEITPNGRPCRERILASRTTLVNDLELRANRAHQGEHHESVPSPTREHAG